MFRNAQIFIIVSSMNIEMNWYQEITTKNLMIPDLISLPNYKCLCAVCNFMLNILVIWNRNNFQGRNMIGSKWKGLINGNNTSQGSNTEVIEVSQGNQTVVSRWKWRFIGHYSITVITKTLSKIKSLPFLAAADPLLMLIWNLIFWIHCKTIQMKYPINSTIELSWFQICVYTS